MLVLLARGHKSQGYTKAVDYWSLGVLMFGMLTGFMPFHHSQVATFIEFMSDPKNKDTMPADYARFYAKITDHVKKNTMSENALKIITSFLQIDEKDRLGTRRNDIARIKEHPFFESIQWTLLEQKLVEPPFIPGALGSANADPSDTNKVENAAAVGAADSNGLELDPDQLIPLENFHVMFARYGNRIVQSTVPGQYQKLFATWDWVAPMALRAELTAQQQKKAYLEHLEELKKMPTVGGLKLLTRAFSTHRGMDPESQHGGHGQSSYRDENSTVSRGFLGDMGKRMSSHSTLSRFSSNHLGLDGSSRKGPESISSSAGMSHANLSFGISSLVSRLSVAGRLGQSDADDQQSSVSMHLSSQQPLCSPTNHGEAASFGITKNAVAISRATSLLKALETGPEVEETL